MTSLDYFIFAAYMIGLLAMGAVFTRRINNSVDMFAAGNQSPWWVAGVSAFMTLFSAATFVVWGGVAFRLGMVAVTILMSLGVAALVVGYTIAPRWRRLGVTTVAEYLEIRFGRGAVQLYTWLTLSMRIIGVGVALYSVAVTTCALMPLPEGAPLRDPQTGHLAVSWAILIGGGVVVAYTVAGGLWAVLMTDVLQFIVLGLSVLFVVPLCLSRVGGVEAFIERSPSGFFALSSGEYVWAFLLLYGVLNYLSAGASWAVVQRYLCVPTERDARKAAYLFGALYLVSPLLWMLPPMIYRTMAPTADPEQAYILACREVLPAGMVGLMLAAMFSATASMADSELNVFAGVLTRDFYARLFGGGRSETHLVLVGRICTVGLGAVVIVLALAVPFVGGAERAVLAITGLFAGPMLLPPVWAMFSRRLSQRGVWWAVGVGFAVAVGLKTLTSSERWLGDGLGSSPVLEWVWRHSQTLEVAAGLLVPLAVLLVLEWASSRTDAGWERMVRRIGQQSTVARVQSSTLPARLVAWSVGLLGLLMAGLAVVDADRWQVLASFSAMLLSIAVAVTLYCRVRRPSRCEEESWEGETRVDSRPVQSQG